MKLQIDKLGKVAVTIEKDYWDINKDYDKLTIVQVEDAFGTYISRKPVLANTMLTDREYWIPFSSLREDIVLDYNSFKAKYDLELSDIKKVLELHTNDIKILRETQTQLSSDINVTLEQVQKMMRTANTTLSTARAAVITANGTSDYVKEKLTEFENSKGAPNGIATLDDFGRVPSSQLPSYVDDVLEFDTKKDFPRTGESGKIYIAKSTEKTYRWSGSTYIEISKSLALGETSSTAYAGNKGKKNAEDIYEIKSFVESLPNQLITNIVPAVTDNYIVIHKDITDKKEDGTYKEPFKASAIIPGASYTYAGAMLPKDKIKLDSLSNNSFNLWEEIENYTSDDDPVTGNKIFPYIFSLTQPKYRQKRILFKVYYFAGENKDVKIDCIALYVGENPSDDTCWKDYDNWILVSTGTRTEDVLLQEQLDSLPNTFYTLNSSEVNSTNGATFIFDKHECQKDGKYATTENAITTIIPMVETSGASDNATHAGLLSFRQLSALSSIPINIVSNIQIESNKTNVNIKLDENRAIKIEQIPAFYPSTSKTIEFPKASSNSAGVMSASDKNKIDSLPDYIINDASLSIGTNNNTLRLNKIKKGTNNQYTINEIKFITLPAATTTAAGLMSGSDKANYELLKESNSTNPTSIVTDLKVQQAQDGSIELQFDKASSYLQGPIKYYNPSQHFSATIPVVSKTKSGAMTPEILNTINECGSYIEELMPNIVAQSFKPKIYLNDSITRKLINIGNLTATTYKNIADELRFDFEFQPDEMLDGLQIKAIITIQVDGEDDHVVTATHTYKKASTDGGINTGNWFNISENLAPYILKTRGKACIVNITLVLPDYSDHIAFNQNIILVPDKIEPLPTSYTINQTGDIVDPDAMISTNFINYNKLNSNKYNDCIIDLKCNSIDNDDIGIDSFKAIYEHVHRYIGMQKEDKIYIKELSSDMQTFTDGTDATKYINSNDPNIDIWTSFDVDIYYRVDTENDIHTVTFAIGDKYIDKTDTNWILFPKFTLIGSYKAYVQTLEDNTKILKSKSGVIPTSDSKNNFNTYIANRGAGFSHINYNAHKFMVYLGYGFLGTTDNGNIIGHGTINIPNDWSTCYPKKTGLTNSNSVTNTKNTSNMSDPLCGTSNLNSITAEVIEGEGTNIKSINFFGLENWWGDVYEYLDGPISMKFTCSDDETSNPKRYVQDYLISKNIDLNNNSYNSFGENKWVAEITYEDDGNIKTELLNNDNFEANASKYCVAIVDESKHIVRFIPNNFTSVMSGCVTKIVGGNKADVIYKAIDSSKTGAVLYCTNSAYYCPNHVSDESYMFIRTYLSNRTRGLIGCYDGNNNQDNFLPYYCARLMFTNTNNVILVEPNKSL